MKRILIACGSGVATSTVANQKISSYLDENGYEGQYKIDQCQVSEVVEKSGDYDFCVATTVVSGEPKCPVLPGLPILTGMGLDKLFADISEEMKK
ncbi:MAG: PTS sugar transporter subunit IIB [Anaerostipes sp.]|jgi:PTS system galactitol-specific IIB component|nr:PTS sugar transporter subunit IIB [Anaerostipes sp.]MDD3746011.1 PTS sugar transporter subunit IIB [Anaerostipes sp.]